MKHKLELKLQAWLDGELLEGESRQVAQWLARDAEAGGLAEDVKRVKQGLCDNEFVRSVPDSREFYWSKIERQIQRESAAVRAFALPWYVRWRYWLAPAASLAILTCALVVEWRPGGANSDETTASVEGMNALTFHDQASHITAVWLLDNGPISPPIQATQDMKLPEPDDSDSDSGFDLE